MLYQLSYAGLLGSILGAISFAVIGRFWVVHHRFLGEVRAFDGRLLGLNLFYLARRAPGGALPFVPALPRPLGAAGDEGR